MQPLTDEWQSPILADSSTPTVRQHSFRDTQLNPHNDHYLCRLGAHRSLITQTPRFF